jgi:hypothetical protein
MNEVGVALPVKQKPFHDVEGKYAPICPSGMSDAVSRKKLSKMCVTCVLGMMFGDKIKGDGM